MEGVRVLTHVVYRCPACSGQHEFGVSVRSRTPTGKLLFGGPSAAGLYVPCPASGQVITINPRVDPAEEVVGLANESGSAPSAQAKGAGAEPSEDDSEYSEWVRTSRSSAVDFGKTLLTASSAAVGLYFAVLEYLDPPSWSGMAAVFGLIPPVLFLSAVAAFAGALRPRLARVDLSDFETFRAARLSRLDRWLTVGLVLFVAGLLAAGTVFAWAAFT